MPYFGEPLGNLNVSGLNWHRMCDLIYIDDEDSWKAKASLLRDLGLELFSPFPLILGPKFQARN